MSNDNDRNLRHNFIVNTLDGGFFGLGVGFASFVTIIPLFVSQMTDSAILIGLIPAIHAMGWQLPQLLTVEHVTRLSRYKPMVVFKVFGAGRFEPKSAFPYVMKAIRPKDGLCIGVDNPQQVAENAACMRRLT